MACNSITEMFGESGTGKTQLCLQLSLLAQFPYALGGLIGSTIYVNTECAFPLRRLNQMVSTFSSTVEEIVVGNPCDDIYVTECHDAPHLLIVLDNAEKLIRSSTTRLPVKLLVIDSIASLFRSQFNCTPTDMINRSALFFRIAGRLKELAFRFGLVVIVTNQVVDFIGSETSLAGFKVGDVGKFFTSGRRICPALGLAWANCVNTRVFLSKCGDGETALFEDGTPMRKCEIVFSPHLPHASCLYGIKRDGVSGVTPSLCGPPA